MNAEELRRINPKAARKIAAEARREERERIREIEEVARPGAEDLIAEAKYEEPWMTADDVARRLVERDQRIRRRASMSGASIESHERE